MTTAANYDCWSTLGDDYADQFEEQRKLLFELAAESPPVLESQIIFTIPSQAFDDDVPF
jgi:hypothetical protein